MDQRSYDMAKVAYQQGDWSRCAATLSASRVPGEVAGAADHLRGNALMKMGLYADAAVAYADALADTSYGKVGALSCNRGRALLAAGDITAAISALTAATQDPEYPTPYKAYLALGNAQVARGDSREAGIAFRNAAIDESNPDPSGALVRLGQCFLDLGRPIDAVEAYRTALDFSGTADNQSAIWAALGKAYVAANRMNEAIDAFGHATSDGTYRLQPSEQTAYLAAQNAMAHLSAGPSETDRLLAAAGYGGAGGYDPLDPTGASGTIMPSPEDTGFFSVTENDIVRQDIAERRSRRPRHLGLKIFLFLLLAAVVAAGVLYWRGYGWPMQEDVVRSVFAASGDELDDYLVASMSDELKAQIESSLPSGATVEFGEITRSMSESSARVLAHLPEGGSQAYQVSLVRDGISWKVSNVEMTFDSLGSPSAQGSSSQASGTADQAADSADASSQTEQPEEEAQTEAQPEQ